MVRDCLPGSLRPRESMEGRDDARVQVVDEAAPRASALLAFDEWHEVSAHRRDP